MLFPNLYPKNQFQEVYPDLSIPYFIRESETLWHRNSVGFLTYCIGASHLNSLSLYVSSCKVQQILRRSYSSILDAGASRGNVSDLQIRQRPPPGVSYLGPQVEVAVDQQHGVAVIPQGQREEAVAVLLEELLQQELGRGREERVLAVRGADVLGRHDSHGVVGHLRGGGRRQPLPATRSRGRLPEASRRRGNPGWVAPSQWAVTQWCCGLGTHTPTIKSSVKKH